MKILLVGANGMLAHDVKAACAQDEILGYDLPELDITDFAQIAQCVRASKPDVVVNCAAYTAVDACESAPDLAFRVNGEGPKNLAIACEKNGCDLLHISTDYVFDGTKPSPYIETDGTSPINIYGQSKLYGEQMVRNHMNHFYIVRTQWLYGLNGGNFVKTIMKLGREKEFVSVVDDQVGNPTYTADLARFIAMLIGSGQYGIYHATNAGGISWYRFTKDIFELAGIKSDVRPITTEQMPRPAARPKSSVLDNLAIRLAGFEKFRDYKEALREYIASMK